MLRTVIVTLSIVAGLLAFVIGFAAAQEQAACLPPNLVVPSVHRNVSRGPGVSLLSIPYLCRQYYASRRTMGSDNKQTTLWRDCTWPLVGNYRR